MRGADAPGWRAGPERSHLDARHRPGDGQARDHRDSQACCCEGLDSAVVVGGQGDPGVEAGRPAGLPDDAEPGAPGPAADPGLLSQGRQVQGGAAAGQPVPAGQHGLEGVVEQVNVAAALACGRPRPSA